MTEAEREARHPARLPQQPGLKRCHACNGTGIVGKATHWAEKPGGGIDKQQWDCICQVCEGRGYERAARQLN